MTFIDKRVCKSSDLQHSLLQAESSLGSLEVAALDGDDLNAALVVLIRSFAASPDSVTVNLNDAG